METTEKTAYVKACDKLGRTPLTIDDFSKFNDGKVMFGKHKHDTCTEAANLDENGKPFVPDFTDGTLKHFPFYVAVKDASRPSGVGFRFSGSDFGLVFSDLGSRLGYSRTSDIVREIGNNAEITEYHNEAMGV
jgi:hypothetical protein